MGISASTDLKKKQQNLKVIIQNLLLETHDPKKTSEIYIYIYFRRYESNPPIYSI